MQIPLSSPSQPKQKSAAKASGTRAQPAAKGTKAGAAIVFPCPTCQHQVRTPASAAGKKGKCPKCGAILKIPARKPSSAGGSGRSQTAGLTPLPDASPGLTPLVDDEPGLVPLGQDEPGLVPLGADTGGLTPLVDDSPGLTPLGDDLGGLTPLPDTGGLTPLGNDPGLVPLGGDPLGASSYPAGGAAASNPFSDVYTPAPTPTYPPNAYQSPAYAPQRRRGVNEWVIKAPAIAMMAISGISLLYVVGSLLFEGLSLGMGLGKEGMVVSGVIMVVIFLIALVAYGLMFLGGYKMFRMESWGIALTGAILMVIPCTFFCMGIPVGIWAIVILSLSDVRAVFD